MPQVIDAPRPRLHSPQHRPFQPGCPEHTVRLTPLRLTDPPPREINAPSRSAALLRDLGTVDNIMASPLPDVCPPPTCAPDNTTLLLNDLTSCHTRGDGPGPGWASPASSRAPRAQACVPCRVEGPQRRPARVALGVVCLVCLSVWRVPCILERVVKGACRGVSGRKAGC